MLIKGALSRNQIVGLFFVVLLAFAILGTAFWIVPEEYHFLLIVGIFLFGIIAELSRAKGRTEKTKQ